MYGENYLAHYGVMGMKWGRRRTKRIEEKRTKAIDEAANSWRAVAERHRKTAQEISSQKYGSKEANEEAAKQYRQSAKNVDVTVKGIEYAKKLTSGMNMQKSIRTLQDSVGYARGERIKASLFGSKKKQLQWAAVDYALSYGAGRLKKNNPED